MSGLKVNGEGEVVRAERGFWWLLAVVLGVDRGKGGTEGG